MSLFRPNYLDKKTGEKKQSATWWYEFVYAGKRYRESTKTSRKTLAANREKSRRLELEQQMTAGAQRVDPARRMRTVKDAVEAYQLAYDAPSHQKKSIDWVNERAPHLIRLLGSLAVFDLSDAKILGYMRVRRNEGVGNRTINMELQCLARAADSTWNKLWPKVPTLHESTDTGQALTAEQESRLLGAASQNKSPYIEPFIHIALSTGMRSGEILHLQLNRIDLARRELRVGKAKTKAGEGRGIPMNEDLYGAIVRQIEWLTKTFGSPKPDWYLFPFCDRVRPVDPTRPVTTVKSAWASVRKAAGVPCRPHDLRHTAATKMAESGIPEATMKSLLGHMSKAMLERYSHIRDKAKRTAVESMGLEKPLFVVPKVSPKVRATLKKRAG